MSEIVLTALNLEPTEVEQRDGLAFSFFSMVSIVGKRVSTLRDRWFKTEPCPLHEMISFLLVAGAGQGLEARRLKAEQQIIHKPNVHDYENTYWLIR